MDALYFWCRCLTWAFWRTESAEGMTATLGVLVNWAALLAVAGLSTTDVSGISTLLAPTFLAVMVFVVAPYNLHRSAAEVHATEVMKLWEKNAELREASNVQRLRLDRRQSGERQHVDYEDLRRQFVELENRVPEPAAEVEASAAIYRWVDSFKLTFHMADTHQITDRSWPLTASHRSSGSKEEYDALQRERDDFREQVAAFHEVSIRLLEDVRPTSPADVSTATLRDWACSYKELVERSTDLFNGPFCGHCWGMIEGQIARWRKNHDEIAGALRTASLSVDLGEAGREAVECLSMHNPFVRETEGDGQRRAQPRVPLIDRQPDE